jgi:hypothetical protein
MATDRYGTNLLFSAQTPSQAQAVIDTAILVWEQMGLSTAQIMYGIAMMDAESGIQRANLMTRALLRQRFCSF